MEHGYQTYLPTESNENQTATVISLPAKSRAKKPTAPPAQKRLNCCYPGKGDVESCLCRECDIHQVPGSSSWVLDNWAKKCCKLPGLEINPTEFPPSRMAHLSLPLLTMHLGSETLTAKDLWMGTVRISDFCEFFLVLQLRKISRKIVPYLL